MEQIDNIGKFIVMLEWYPSFQELTNEEKGILFNNFFQHHLGGKLDTSNRLVNSVWKLIEPNMVRINNAYQKNIQNGKKGGAPKGTTPWNKKVTQTEPIANPTQTQTEAVSNRERNYKEKDKEKDKEKEKDKDKEKEKYKVKENLMSSNMSTNTNSGENLKNKFLDDIYKDLKIL